MKSSLGVAFSLCCIMVLANSCQQLNDLGPSETDTYVRYFGDPGNNVGVDIEQADNGDLVLLGYNVAADTNTAWVITTDAFGNQSASVSISNFLPRDLVVTTDGYYVIGDGIYEDQTQADSTVMSIVFIPTSGGIQKQEIDANASYISFGTGGQFHGSAINVDAQGNIVALGYYLESGRNRLIYAQLNFPNGVSWVRRDPSTNSFSPGKSLIKRGANYIWQASTDRGFAFEVPPNQIPGAVPELPVNVAVDIGLGAGADFLGGVGTTSDGQVTFYKLNSGMSLVSQKTLGAGQALSITAPAEGGYVILSTSGGNFTLHRTDLNGLVDPGKTFTFSKAIDWTSTESSGTAIKVQDGGYAIFGTSAAGGASMMVLIKTDKRGDL